MVVLGDSVFSVNVCVLDGQKQTIIFYQHLYYIRMMARGLPIRPVSSPVHMHNPIPLQCYVCAGFSDSR